MGAFLQDERVESLWQQLLESVQIGVLSTKAGKISNWRGGQTFSVIQLTELFKYLSEESRNLLSHDSHSYSKCICTLWTEVIEDADFKGKNVVKQNLPVYIYNL
jgi:hypothetical protein